MGILIIQTSGKLPECLISLWLWLLHHSCVCFVVRLLLFYSPESSGIKIMFSESLTDAKKYDRLESGFSSAQIAESNYLLAFVLQELQYLLTLAKIIPIG